MVVMVIRIIVKHMMPMVLMIQMQVMTTMIMMMMVMVQNVDPPKDSLRLRANSGVVESPSSG